MKPEHTRLHEALATLAPPKRFQLLLLLLGGADRSVSQLAMAVRLSQSCTTRHLQALERAGLVKGMRDGKRVVFRPLARDPAAANVLASLPGGVGVAISPESDEIVTTQTISVGNTRPASRVGTPPGAARAASGRGSRRNPPNARDQAVSDLPVSSPPSVPAESSAIEEGRSPQLRPLPTPDIPAPESAPAQPAGESGNNSSEDAPDPAPRPRRWADLEDFLL